MVERKRILIVDDDDHLLVILKDYLVFEGFNVQTAGSAEKALEKLDRFQPNLVVLDIGMPGMGGLGFLRRIVDARGKPRYPVLVFSARSALEQFFGTIDVDGFLAKPASELELVSLIRDILRRHDRDAFTHDPTRKHILVAEDDPRHVRAIRHALEKAGYAPVFVDSGPAALEHAAADHPDLMLVKECLPRMNGSALAPLVAMMPGTHDIPVVLYDDTRHADEDHDPVPKPPGVRHLVLSADPEDLLEAVRKTLANR